MAKVRRKRKKTNFIKKRIIGLLVALGITGIGIGEYEFFVVKDQNKELEQNATDLDELRDIVDNSREKQTIEDEIKKTLNKGLTFAEDKIEESLEAVERKKELVKENIEETIDFGKELLPTESLDFSKDENKIITSYNDKYEYNYENLVIPVIEDFTSVSIIDVLNGVGYDSSLNSRARLAVYFNIVSSEKEFDGTPIQNTTLLKCLREHARNLQNSVYNNYIKAIDNSTIENSVSNDSYTYDYTDDQNIKINQEDENKETEDIKDNGDKDHELSWSEWKDLDDENEYRVREDGVIEKRSHSYSEWIDNGDGTESKTCSNPNCGHVVTRKRHVHQFEKQKPESLNKTDNDYCMVIDSVCLEDGYVDETLREYIPHKLSETPIAVDGDQGLFQCGICEMYIIKTIEQAEHIHHPEETKPVSLNRTDEKYCMVIDSVCPDDGYVDETLRRYVEHDFPEEPEIIDGDQGLFKCKICKIYVTKKISNVNDENISSSKEDEDQEINATFNFEFDTPLEDEYECFDQKEIDPSKDLPVIVDNNEFEIKNNTEIIESTDSLLQTEAEQDKIQNILESFDTNLYKKLFKEKVAIEQSLATNKGIEKLEKLQKLQLLKKIDVIKENMVQDLANALVEEELNRMDKSKSQELIFKA